MAFKDNILEFSDDKIVEQDSMVEVMMDWEAPIMEKSAEYICESKGNILEIGFGLGICSNYIQSQGVNSHTIVEIHPQILEKLNEWASDKDNVNVIEGDWSSLDFSDKYDGIFLDTFGDDNLDKFKDFAVSRATSGAKVTYWNNKEEEYNPYLFDSVSYDKISITPVLNIYTEMKDFYYMPKVVL